MQEVLIYTDGSARGNPGPGGYGILLKSGKHYKEISQGFRLTTNNRMELMAIIVALESLKTNKLKVQIFSDSKYVIDSITKGWVYGWAKKGFAKKKNPDLWKRFLQVSADFTIQYNWVKGHNGHPENERCDVIAVEAALGQNLSIDTYFEQVQQHEKD